ncbi:archaeosortase/exosortase family protein [Bacteroidales bacterium OttesenSCG-928-A17]|nr:archaeosortase/exosortase family protein [Bacteroidales bacterium OttesenSCG-928-A17]
MKIDGKKIRRILEPYSGVLLFLFLLFFFHFSWKIAVDGDMDDVRMYVFGRDCTPSWFDSACLLLAKAVYWVIHFFPGGDDFIRDGDVLYYLDGMRVRIIWGCTGIKQMFIFSGIILFYRGPFLKKLWYIPLGCLVLTIYNIIRLVFISVLTHHHPERFDSLHDGIFRFIYYGIVFLLWVIWEECFTKKRNYGNQEQKNSAPSGEHAC